MIREPSDNVIVKIQNIKTGECTKSMTFKAPKPGLVTMWDFKTGFRLDDIKIRVDWPMKTEPLIIAARDFVLGWKQFISKIDWQGSNLDADAVRFMNEVPGKIEAGLDEAEKNTAACGRF